MHISQLSEQTKLLILFYKNKFLKKINMIFFNLLEEI